MPPVEARLTSNAMSRMAIASSGLLVAVVMALPSSPIGMYFSLPVVETDYGTHTTLAEAFLTNGILFPHFLWHVIVIAVHTVMPWLSWMDAAKIVVIASYALQGAVVAWIITSMIGTPRHMAHAAGVAVLALAFVIATPVTILTWREYALYFGYLNMESYASPTQALLKPLALLVFAFTARGLVSGGSLRDGAVLFVTVVLSALVKPSLLICLLPATGMLAAWRWLGGARHPLVYLAGAVVVPSVAILTWQYLFYFGSGERSAIVFAPFLVMGYYATGLGPKFLMSIVLPVTVLVVYGRQVLALPAMQLGWVQFAIAVACTYLLAETREPLAGNFAWTGQIATYLLFVASAVFAMRRWAVGWASAVCAVAFSLHVASGVLFFVYPTAWGAVPAA
jgi:hypothetical protein